MERYTALTLERASGHAGLARDIDDLTSATAMGEVGPVVVIPIQSQVAYFKLIARDRTEFGINQVAAICGTDAKAIRDFGLRNLVRPSIRQGRRGAGNRSIYSARDCLLCMFLCELRRAGEHRASAHSSALTVLSLLGDLLAEPAVEPVAAAVNGGA